MTHTSQTIQIVINDQTVHLHYYESGAGPVVLFIHGWGHSGRRWVPFFEHLPGYRLIAIDLPGHGRSDPVAGELRHVEAYARMIDGFVRQLCMPPVHAIVGHSMGGILTHRAMMEDPELSERAFIFGAPFRYRGMLQPLTWCPLVPQLVIGAKDVLPARFVINGIRTFGGLFAGRKAIDSILIDDAMRLDVGTAVPLLREVVRLNEPCVPLGSHVVLARGEHERILPQHDLDDYARRIGAGTYVFPGAAHAAHTETPDHFAQVIQRFVADQPL